MCNTEQQKEKIAEWMFQAIREYYMKKCTFPNDKLHHPELAGKPMAVGGDPKARHGIVLTANYIAKRAGVKTGMALWQASLPGNNFCTASHGSLFEVFQNGTGDLQ